MTHEEFLRSLATRFHGAMRNRGDARAPSVSAFDQGDAGSEAVARWLAWHMALYFQRCSRVDFEACTAWKYWHRDAKEDVDWTIYTGYCETHRNHPERTRLKTVVLGDTQGGYSCEIHDWSSRTIERTEGRVNERAGSVVISDLAHLTRRQHTGRIRWISLARSTGPSVPNLASEEDVIEDPEFALRPANLSSRTSGQDQGAAFAAAFQNTAERANDASLSYRIERELNRLAPEVYRRPPRPGEGVLAVVETETQQHPMGVEGNTFLNCFVHGVFSSPRQGIRDLNRARGLSIAPHQGAQFHRRFYWGILEAQ
jgi:hypothetical protein